MMKSCVKIDELYIENDEVCIKMMKSCVKIDEFCIENDDCCPPIDRKAQTRQR